MRMTQEQLDELLRRRKQTTTPRVAEAQPRPSFVSDDPSPKKASKYRNTRVERHGLKFDSLLEADWYDHLRWLWSRGAVLWFARQVKFELPGGVSYRADFVVMYAAGKDSNDAQLARPEVQDCKGYDTRESKNKRKQVKELHRADVRIIRRNDLQVRSV